MPTKGARKSSSKKAPGRPLKVPLKESFIHVKEEDISVDDEESCPQVDEEESGPQDEEPSQLSGASFYSHGSSTTSVLSSSPGRASVVAKPKNRLPAKRGPAAIVLLNCQTAPLPYSLFRYNESIAKGLDEFEPYKPLLESKNYTTVKVWARQHDLHKLQYIYCVNYCIGVGFTIQHDGEIKGLHKTCSSHSSGI